VLAAPTGAHIAFLAVLVTLCECRGMRLATASILLPALLATLTPAARADGDGAGGARSRPEATRRAADRPVAAQGPSTADAPLLVSLLPGVALAVDSEEELFFADGQFWARREGAWYRSLHPRASFVRVGPERVPPALRELPPPPDAGIDRL
jgi:hypothetical protein